jgi:amino acid transporter
MSEHQSPITAAFGAPPQVTMKKVLGLPAVIAYGLSSMGLLAVFTIYGTGTRLSEGHLPAAYLVAIVAMLLTAHSYARMAWAVPRSGSAYVYSRMSFGPFVGFLTGWVMLLDYMFLPMVNFLLIGIYLNSVFTAVPMWIFTLAAILLVLCLSIIGVSWIGRLNLALSVVALLVVGAFVALALTHAENLTLESLTAPLLPENGSLGSVMAAAAVLSFAFLGFDGVSTLAEETRDPRRTIPRGVVLSTLFIGVIFFLVAWAGNVLFPDWTQLTNLDAAGTEMMAAVGGGVLTTAFLVVYLLSTVLCGTAAQMSVSRVIFAMGRDGMLPRPLAFLHPRFRTPYVAAIAVSVVSLTALFITLDQAVYMINFGALVAFAVVNLAMIKHFWWDRRDRGPWQAVRHLLLPVLGFAFIAYLWSSLAPFTFILGGSWLLIGLAILAWRTGGFRRQPPAIALDEDPGTAAEPRAPSAEIRL